MYWVSFLPGTTRWPPPPPACCPPWGAGSGPASSPPTASTSPGDPPTASTTPREANSIFGRNLWNNLVQPWASKAVDYRVEAPLLCPPQDRPFLSTQLNS